MNALSIKFYSYKLLPDLTKGSQIKYLRILLTVFWTLDEQIRNNPQGSSQCCYTYVTGLTPFFIKTPSDCVHVPTGTWYLSGLHFRHPMFSPQLPSFQYQIDVLPFTWRPHQQNDKGLLYWLYLQYLETAISR